MQAIIMNQNTANIDSNKIITARDVAEKSGYALSTVYMALGKNNKATSQYNSETVNRIRKVAEEMGYDPNRARRGHQLGRHWTTSASGNFATRQEETERMLYLRHKKAMTNQEIADKIGVTHDTVVRRIGVQPKELTAMSFALYGERKARRNQARRHVLLKQKIAQFNRYKQEVDAINARALELEERAQRIADEAKAVRDQYSSKVIELGKYRKDAQAAATELGCELE